MPPVAFQLRFAGAPGADAAALPGKTLAHTGKPWQQVLILGQFHLEPAFLRLRPLGENIHDQCASVQHRYADDFLQRPDISRGKLIVKNHHGGSGGLHQHPDLPGLALADKAVGIRAGPVLQHLPGAEASGGFQKRFQFLQRLVRSGLLLGKAGSVQTHQDRTLLFRLKISFHFLPP